MPKNSQVLRIDPPEVLSFKGPFTEVVKSTLTLTNPSDSKVAFKIKTTAPKRYCVRPNSGTLQKNESISISVMLQPFDFDPYEKTKHKFMIQSVVVSADLDEKDVWAEADKDKLMDTKLRVVFDTESTPSVPEVVEEEEQSPTNDLDITTETVKMTPHKANLITPVKPSAGGDDDAGRVEEENRMLRKEIETLQADLQRQRHAALSSTKSAGAPAATSQTGAQAQGVGLLFQDTTNIIIIVVLLLASFTSGLLFSDRLLGA